MYADDVATRADGTATAEAEEARLQPLTTASIVADGAYITRHRAADYDVDVDVFGRTDLLSPWPTRRQPGSEELVESYTTPLTPRRQDRRVSSKQEGSGGESSRPRDASRTDTSSQQKPVCKERSASLGDVFAAEGLESLKGYRRIERALEAQSRVQQRIRQGRSSMDELSSSRYTQPKNAGPSRDRTFAGQLPAPDVIEEFSRPYRQARQGSPDLDGATSLAARGRAVSEPFDALTSRGDVRQEKAQQVEADDFIYRPLQTRPLSLLLSEQPPLSSSTPKHLFTYEEAPTGVSSPPPLEVLYEAGRSTPLSSRIAAGEGASKLSHEAYRGLSMSTRPSFSIILQNRAQARFHLSALSAMRPRLPASPNDELDAVVYTSWLPRLHYICLLLITYSHVLVTIFFDYNVLFSTIQVAIYPNSTFSGVSAAWWIASGLYAASFLIWFIGVLVVWEYFIQYRRRWTNTRPFALPIYLSSSAFTLTSVRTYSFYSLFYRTRFSAARKDFIIETFWLYSQNWPTALTLLPRGIILTVFLVIYNPHTGSGDVPMDGQVRDLTYFDPSTGLLTTFSFGILVANAAWIAWRLMILTIAYIGLFFTLGFKAMFEREKTSYEWAGSDSMLALGPQGAERDALGQGGFSSTLIHQPLLEEGALASRYDLREPVPLAAPEQQEEGRRTPLARPAASTASLPHWAWKARAEERLLMLLQQRSHLEMDIGNNTPVPRRDGHETPEPATAPYPEMQEIGVALVGPPRMQASGSNGPRLVTLRAPVLNRRSCDARPSYSSDVRGSVDISSHDLTAAATPPIPLTITAVAHENFSRPRTSLQQTNSGKVGRPSSSSDLSLPIDALGRVSVDSRDNSEKTIDSAATVGQGARRHTTVDDPFPFEADRSLDTGRDQLSSTIVASSPAARSQLATPPVIKKERATSPISSLPRSLPFMRSNKSGDKIKDGSLDPSALEENFRSTIDTPWWFRSRSKAREAPSAPPEQKTQGEMSNTVADDEGKATTNVEGETASQETAETSSTEDSEEGRLWNQFPELSRRYSPGLSALEMEQKRLVEDDRRLSFEQDSGPSMSSLLQSARNEAAATGQMAINGQAARVEGLRPIIEEESYGSQSHGSHG